MVNGTTFPKHQTFAYRQFGMSLRNQPIKLTNESGLEFAHFTLLNIARGL